MAYYGYHRVSTKEQHEDRGVFELEAFCEEKNISLAGSVFCDKQTGKNFSRPEYRRESLSVDYDKIPEYWRPCVLAHKDCDSTQCGGYYSIAYDSFFANATGTQAAYSSPFNLGI